MTNNQPINDKRTDRQRIFDLEERTLEFSKNVISFIKTLKFDIVNGQLIPQCVRSATSIGANYREANDALGKKDFVMRIRICRKEAKETHYWFQLIVHANKDCSAEVQPLLQESTEFIKIFSAIAGKSQS